MNPTSITPIHANIYGWRYFRVIRHHGVSLLTAPVHGSNGFLFAAHNPDDFFIYSLWDWTSMSAHQGRPVHDVNRGDMWTRNHDMGLTSGMYAFKSKARLLREYGPALEPRYLGRHQRSTHLFCKKGANDGEDRRYGVAAIVQLAGQVAEHEHGYRAEKLRIITLASPADANTRRGLAHAIGVPKIYKLSEMPDQYTD